MAQLIGEVTAEQVRNHKKRWRMLQVSAGTEKWLSATLTLFLEQGTTCSVQINGARCHLSARLITRFIQQLRDTRHERVNHLQLHNVLLLRNIEITC